MNKRHSLSVEMDKLITKLDNLYSNKLYPGSDCDCYGEELDKVITLALEIKSKIGE